MRLELRQMWILAKEIQDLSEQVEELESICQRMTASYDPVGPVRGGSVDRGDDKLAALADLRSTYIETKEEWTRMEEQLMERCKPLQERDALMLRGEKRKITYSERFSMKRDKCHRICVVFSWIVGG